MKVAFIGLGIMGSRMAMNVLKGGHELTIYNRTAEKAQSLIEAGATLETSIDTAVAVNDVVITMLSTPEVVKSVAQSLLQASSKDAIWINSSTIDPSTARALSSQATAHNVRYLDAPVAGTKAPAEKGELVFFVGGDQAAKEQSQPLFDLMGQKAVFMGPAGNASSMKLLVNTMLAQSMAAFAETVSLGKAMGLPQQAMFDVLLNAPVSAPFLKNVRPRLESNDPSVNFPLKWMHKDLHLSAIAGFENNLPLPLTNAAKELFASANSSGRSDEDFSSLFYHLNA